MTPASTWHDCRVRPMSGGSCSVDLFGSLALLYPPPPLGPRQRPTRSRSSGQDTARFAAAPPQPRGEDTRTALGEEARESARIGVQCMPRGVPALDEFAEREAMRAGEASGPDAFKVLRALCCPTYGYESSRECALRVRGELAELAGETIRDGRADAMGTRHGNAALR